MVSSPGSKLHPMGGNANDGGLSAGEKMRREVGVAASAAGSIPRQNILRFSIARQVLSGNVGGKEFGPIRCNSGGGQTGFEASVSVASLNPRRQTFGSKTTKFRERGGALPPGWWIVIPEGLQKGERSSLLSTGAAPTANSLKIVPYQLEKGYGDAPRFGFYIHGTGGDGSEGCLLLDPAHRAVLVRMVCKAGGAWLQSYLSSIELEQELQRSQHADRTA